MKILVFSDLHNEKMELPLVKPDLILLLGDIYWKEVKRIDSFFSCPKLGVLGNHDRMDTFENTSIINLHKKTIQIDDLTFGGFEGSPRYNNREGAQHTEKEAHVFMNQLEYVDIFIAHANPMWELYKQDKISDKGFKSFTQYIEREEPILFLHGHLHEPSEKMLKSTTVVCVYPTIFFEI